jgi:hypothetical protein
MLQLRKRLGRSVRVFADQAETPDLEQAGIAPNSKANYGEAFFDSIGQTEKNSVRARVFRIASEGGPCSNQSAFAFVPMGDVRASRLSSTVAQ